MSVAGLLGLPFWLVALIGSAGLVAVLIWLERRQSWKTEIGADYDGLMPQISERAAADHAPAAGLAEKPFLKAHGAISEASARRTTALESCEVPLWEVKTWLAGAAAAIDIGDVEGGTLPEFVSREQRSDTKFLRWDGTEEGAASGRAILASAHGLEAGPARRRSCAAAGWRRSSDVNGNATLAAVLVFG